MCLKKIFAQKLVIAAFILCFCYWSYLYQSAQMKIAMDAKTYETFGQEFYDGGFANYLKTGPKREPLYPFLISSSMRIADLLNTPYQNVQKCFQIIILFLAQLLTLILLRRLSIRPVLVAGVILYMGISPAIVNGTFSLFSEIISLPIVPAIVLLNFIVWRSLSSCSTRKIFFLSVCSAVIYLLATFSRGLFQYVMYIFLVNYGVYLIIMMVKYKKRAANNAALYIFLTLLIFQSCFIFYKYQNLKYNGHFAYSDRFDRLLYGNAVRRSRTLTPGIIIAHLSSIPGGGFCRRFFNNEICRYCEFEVVDEMYGYQLSHLLQGVSDKDATARTLQLAKERILETPGQYILIMLFEGAKMFFWESTQIGYVNYPIILTRLFENSLFKDSLRLVVSVITLIGVVSMLIFVLTKRRQGKKNSPHQDQYIIYCFSTLMILSYTGLYSLFCVLTRYAIPLTPLFLIAVAFFVENRIKHYFPKSVKIK